MAERDAVDPARKRIESEDYRMAMELADSYRAEGMDVRGESGHPVLPTRSLRCKAGRIAEFL